MKFLKISCLAVALLLGSSSTAQAQSEVAGGTMECLARIEPTTVRAEGLAEAVGDVVLRCLPNRDDPFSFVPDPFTVQVQLPNTRITSQITDRIRREVSVVERTVSRYLIPPDAISAPELSADGRTITWELSGGAGTFDLVPGGSGSGFRMTVSMIRANASLVGAGRDIEAMVIVEGDPVDMERSKAADVQTGLDVTVTETASGTACASMGSAESTVRIQEGFIGAISNPDHNELVVTFSGVPQGVTVKVPALAGLPADDPVTLGIDEMDSSFELRINRNQGLDSLAGGMGTVTISNAGRGEVRYEITAATLNPVLSEWNDLGVTFSWGSAGVAPSPGRAEVQVSYHPISNESGETIGITPVPRFTAGVRNTALSLDDCTTRMVFPFLTNQQGYETGIVLSNPSGLAGRCEVEALGARGGTMRTEVIPPHGQKAFALSSEFPGFQGQMNVECSFQNGDGYAYVLSPEGDANSGYLPRLLTN